MKETQCFEDICGCTVDSCPITYSMKMIGGKWRPIIIMRIAQNINRFGILHRGIDGISKNMLTRDLRDLEKNGIISRKIYAEIPPRVEYSLTKKGKTLVPVLAFKEISGLLYPVAIILISVKYFKSILLDLITLKLWVT